MLLCLNNSNCADGGGRCISGVCVCTNYIIRHNSLTLPMIGAILRDLSSLRYFYIIIFSIIALIGLINNIFSFFTFIRDRIRFTICGIYLLLFSLCGIILMLLFLTNLIVAFHYEHYGVRLWACQGYPYVFQAMIYMELLLTTAIVVENILSRYFGLNRFRSRRCAILVFTIFFILVFPLNLDKIFTRHLVYTPSGRLYCTHRPQSSSFWYYINKSTFYCYIITPLIIHFISLIFILWKIKKQKQQWHLKIFLHQDILLPSFLILVCLFPYVLFRQLLDSCLMNNQLLIRLHIGLILLLLIPQIFTFIIYVLPNMYYIKEFQQTGFYYILCCGTKKGRELTDFENVSRLWHRRTSLETVMTISSLNDVIDDILLNFFKHAKNSVTKKRAPELLDKEFAILQANTNFTDFLFTLFDKNGDKSVDFSEFVLACGIIGKKDMKNALELAFNMLDRSGDGYITYEEMVNFTKTAKIFEDNESFKDLDPETVATAVFDMFVLNKEQKLSKEQFINGCLINEDLSALFGKS